MVPPEVHLLSGEPFLLCSRRSVRGTVALADSLGIAVATLALRADGIHVERFVDVGDTELPPDYTAADPVSVAAALAQVVEQHGFPRRLACLALDDSLSGASLADLPAARGDAMDALVARHVRDELPVQRAPVLADHVRLDPLGVGEDGRRCWVAWSDQQTMQGLAVALLSHDLRVSRVLPPSVALLDAVGRVQTDADQRLELTIRFCWPSVVIGVFAGGQPQYARFLGDLLSDGAVDPLEAGVLEVGRTVGFIRERNRGRAPDLVRHTGLDASRGHEFERRLEEELGVPSVALEFAAHGERGEGRRDRLNVLAALLHHGVDRGRRGDATLDLLPPRVRRDTGFLASAAAVVLMTAAASAWYVTRAGDQELALRRTRDELGAAVARLEPADALRRQRLDELGRIDTWSAALAVLPDSGRDPVRPLLEASLALPDGARMGKAHLDTPYSGPSQLRLQLSGDFTGPDSAALDEYLALLGSRPWVGDLSARRGELVFDRGSRKAAEELLVEVRLR